jgi:hypothetical protein
MRSGISIICAADVTCFGFVFVRGSYRELVAYRQAATPLWLRDYGFYLASMAHNPRGSVIEALRLPPTYGQGETCVDGGRATQEQCLTTVSFIAPTHGLTLVTPRYGKLKPLLNGAARIGARIV